MKKCACSADIYPTFKIYRKNHSVYWNFEENDL